jgi:ribonuclease Y
MVKTIIIALVVGIVCLIAGIGVGIVYRKKVAEKEIGSAEMEATRLINEAIRSGENRKKEMLLEAKDEIHKSRTEHDKEVKERRAELSKQERRLEQKEATLDKKTEAFERKEEDLAKKLQKVAETQAQADAVKQQQIEDLKKTLEVEDACLLMVPSTDTSKIVEDGYVKETLIRSTVYNAQTPQCFKTDLIKKCYQKGKEEKKEATDDAQLVEWYSDVPVKAVLSDPSNIKITHPTDLKN